MNRNRFLTIAFSASVGLNIFFLSSVAVRVVKHWSSPDHLAQGKRGPHKGGPDPMRLVLKMVRVMGGKDDPRVRAVWMESRKSMRGRHDVMVANYRELTDALTATPYSEARLNSALQLLGQGAQSAQNDAHGVVLQLASQLRPEERQALKAIINKHDD